jgi:lysophospholipase L1-like esterase
MGVSGIRGGADEGRRGVSTGAALVLMVFLAGCGKNPVTPTPDAPQLTCPSPITVSGVLGGVQAVTYTVPSATGGSTPVNTTCAPPSGSGFPIGTSAVTCTAVDSINRQATCTFSVTLSPVVLSVHRFVAFGDSVTAGEDGRTAQIRVRFIDPVRSYPAVLLSRISTDFPDQGISVVNEGRGGEFADDGTKRLSQVLDSDRPEVLLLLEGYNDLLNFGARAADAVVVALRDDVRLAKSRGVQQVLVSTLTPPRKATGPRDRAIELRAIQDTNAKLIPMAAAEGARVVNAYDAFLGREQDLVGDDGLHLTPAGNEVLADLFYAAIRDAGLTAAWVR